MDKEIEHILEEGITEEIEDKPAIPDKQDTTSEFLTEEEEEQDAELKQLVDFPKEAYED